jgi:CDP-glycerol glycerophosphotransferase (TagB/SpsB family)
VADKKRILFTGYAPIHFICFLPVYKRLVEDENVEIFLSGGFRKKDGDDITFSLDGFYDPYDIDQSHVITMERVKNEDFDVLVSAHLSDMLFPRSVKKTVQIYHGVSFKNLAVRDKALRFDMLCLPGRYHAELYRKNGFIREDDSKCLVTGFSKTDALVSGEIDREAVLKAIGVDPKRPTILFAPTGEKHNALDTMGHEVIKAVSEAGVWNLLVKPHDHPKKDIDWFAELEPLENDSLRIVRDFDIIPYLASADLLITDASSVAVEFTLLDRPIVFMDIPKLFKRLKKRAPSLDLETYGRKIGDVVANPDELQDVITKSLAEPGRASEIRRKMAEHLFYAPGRASENVAAVVRYAAGLISELPDDVLELSANEEATKELIVN